ncbi:hypothetical protein D9M72_307010 [compost metagenome]
MERGALVVEHHVVRARDAHDEVDARRAQQHEQRVHVVLVGFGVVGVADVAADRQAHQLAAEVVFEPGTNDLLAVVQVLGADEADHGVDEQRLVAPRQRIGAHLAGLLVDAEVGVGRERAALAGLEVHEVVADGATRERLRRGVGLVEQSGRHAEREVRFLGARDRLEHEVDRRAGFGELQRVGHVREHAALRGNLEALDHLVEHVQQAPEHRQAVGHGVDADHRVARAVEQAVERGGGHAAQVVGGVVGLQAHGQVAGQADGVAKARDDVALLRDRDQVLVAHELGHGRDHLGREARCQCGECLCGGLLGQQPVAEVADREVRDRREGLRVVRVDDQPRDVVLLVGNQRLGEELLERRVGQHVACGHALLRGRRAEAREVVARARGAGAGEHLSQIVEGEALAGNGGAVAHRVVGSLSGRG